jgi:hypothetical protein
MIQLLYEVRAQGLEKKLTLGGATIHPTGIIKLLCYRSWDARIFYSGQEGWAMKANGRRALNRCH